MVKLLLFGEELVGYLYHWIVVAEAIWILITTELVRNIALKIMLNIQYKALLHQCLLQQDSFQVEDIDKLTNTNDKS